MIAMGMALRLIGECSDEILPDMEDTEKERDDAKRDDQVRLQGFLELAWLDVPLEAKRIEEQEDIQQLAENVWEKRLAFENENKKDQKFCDKAYKQLEVLGIDQETLQELTPDQLLEFDDGLITALKAIDLDLWFSDRTVTLLNLVSLYRTSPEKLTDLTSRELYTFVQDLAKSDYEDGDNDSEIFDKLSELYDDDEELFWKIVKMRIS